MSELDLIFNRKKKTEEESKGEKASEVATEEKVEEKVEEKNETQPIEKTPTNVEEIMKKFIDRDPKIGVWSYPSYLLLQYLYNTIPGFKMSRVAKEALEKGLMEMYPELFKTAEKVAKETKKI